MAVYTDLGTERLAALIAAYDVGDLVSAKGIAEGVSNSNWLIETSGRDGGTGSQGARFILTMYERRIETADLPFFLDLLDHLSAAGCPVPRTIHEVPCGARGCTRRLHPISCGVRSPLMLLHLRQQATRFSHVSAPPRERGSTWSIVVACASQYAQRLPSRRSTPRRVSGTRRACGMRT